MRPSKVRLRGRPGSSFYRVYGLSLRSHWQLPFPKPGGEESGLAAVELREGSWALFDRASRQANGPRGHGDWYQHVRLRDGSDYLRWSGLFEFLVSADGRRITCRALPGARPEAFHAYLLGQALSFALLKQRIEPLHSTAVVIGGKAVGFAGDCGYGKSSLAAAFLRTGHRLLTDDLLVLTKAGNGFIAYPGPPRIKLYPEIAKSLLGERIGGTPINGQTRKLVIPLERDRTMVEREALPLKAIYVLTPPLKNSFRDRITIRSLSPRRACVELLRNTFNTIIVDPRRLQRQFRLATKLASNIPVKSLSYPRRLARLSAVREAIEEDLAA